MKKTINHSLTQRKKEKRRRKRNKKKSKKARREEEEKKKREEEEKARIEEERRRKQEEEDRVEIHEDIQEIADKVFVTAIKIISEIRRASDLSAYATHPKLGPRHNNNFKTKLSCTMHVGSLIEGVIGSNFKIDNLYLPSPSLFAVITSFPRLFINFSLGF